MWDVAAPARSRRARSQSLERGLAVLSAFGAGVPELGVSELARTVGLTRSTSHRYAATLARLGYLQQDPRTRKYRLGPRVLDLGFAAISSMEIRQISAPHLRQLSDETGHTVSLAVLDGLDILYIDRCRAHRSGQEVDLNLHAGSRLPAYCTSMGKVLLAHLPVCERAKLLDRIDFAERGPNTIVERRALVAELERVRARGLAVNNEELAYGLRSIAAPVRGHDGAVVAAINIADHGTASSVDELVARLGPALRRTAGEISAGLGYRPLAPAARDGGRRMAAAP